MGKLDDKDKKSVYDEFEEAVNMTPKELEKWLATDESQEAGWHGGDGDSDGETVGHESGRRIVAIKQKKKGELDDDDYAHMKKVVGYVKRHMAQRPEKSDDELEDMTWTHSLKNWGHDPLKDAH